MDALEQSRFDALYAQHLRALKLQGKAAATVDGYARAVERVAACRSLSRPVFGRGLQDLLRRIY